jgi:hypothetical protein
VGSQTEKETQSQLYLTAEHHGRSSGSRNTSLNGFYFHHGAHRALPSLLPHKTTPRRASLQKRGEEEGKAFVVHPRLVSPDRVSTMSFYALKATLFRRSFAQASVFASATPLSTPWHTSFVRTFASKKVRWRQGRSISFVFLPCRDRSLYVFFPVTAQESLEI